MIGLRLIPARMMLIWRHFFVNHDKRIAMTIFSVGFINAVIVYFKIQALDVGVAWSIVFALCTISLWYFAFPALVYVVDSERSK